MPGLLPRSTRRPLSLLGGSAVAALAVALAAAAPASAQGLLGTGIVVGGDANAQIFTSPNQTNILVNQNQAIIDWTPTDAGSAGPIDFLPAGNSAFFDANSTVSDFTVLNRIQPRAGSTGVPVDRLIEVNGLVQSRTGNAIGGNVWFYSPGGILVGSTGVFDVGGLVLTSNAIDVTGGLFGADGEIRFRGAADSSASVTIAGGAQINAPASGGYVAMVAPRVTMSGTVRTNGSTAYVGAEQADLRINGGLFDITMTVGTTDAHGVVHDGTTTGPASAPVGSLADPQRIFMVAMPKNQAMTMLLSGAMGYTPAASASQEGSAIILSAAHNIAGGDIVETNDNSQEPSALVIGTTDFSSAVTGRASGAITIDPGAGGTTLFRSTAGFTAQGPISLTTASAETVRAQEGLSLTSVRPTGGGTIAVTSAGTIDLGATTLTLNARDDNADLSGNSIGGNIAVTAAGGTITAGRIDADATASGGGGVNTRGGTVDIGAISGGSITIDKLVARASGDALFDTSSIPVNGGNAVGGTIRITGAGGTLTLGQVELTAQATGGLSTSGQGGSATGGNILVDILSGSHQWSSLFADTSTSAGFADNGGISGGAGGGVDGIIVNVTGANTLLDITGSVSAYASANAFGGGATPTVVRGGAVAFNADSGGTLRVARDLYAATRGQGDFLSAASTTPVTPNSFGGTIAVHARNGRIEVGSLFLDAGAAAGFGDSVAGPAQAGSIELFVRGDTVSPGAVVMGDCVNSACSLLASAVGGSGAVGSDATGGTITIRNEGGLLSAPGTFNVEADGRAGRANGSGMGGNGQGGVIAIEQTGGQTLFGDVFVRAIGSASSVGEGTFFDIGNGGTGTGGQIDIGLASGSLRANILRASADGEGGYAGTNCIGCSASDIPYVAGDGFGGRTEFALTGGTATVDFVRLSADGFGGSAGAGNVMSGEIPGVTGAATGGTVILTAQGGSMTSPTITLHANGIGGSSVFTGGSGQRGSSVPGGTGRGGSASFVMNAGGDAMIDSNDLTVEAEGVGSVSESGGDGVGGAVSIALRNGRLVAASIQARASGRGSDGADLYAGDGGDGTGGTTNIVIANGNHGIASIETYAEGRAGEGGSSSIGGVADDAGGTGGNGLGGAASVQISTDIELAQLAISADGTGFHGGDGLVRGGAGGDGRGGRANLDVIGGNVTIGTVAVVARGTGSHDRNGLGPLSTPHDSALGIGGEAGALVTGASTSLVVQSLETSADGMSGVPNSSGASTQPSGSRGGIARTEIMSGGSLSAATLLSVSAQAGQMLDPQSADFEAIGGRASFVVDGGTVRSQAGAQLTISSWGSGFQASGGTSELLLNDANISLPAVSLYANARANASGTETAGTVRIRNEGSSSVSRQAASILAESSAVTHGTAGSISLADTAGAPLTLSGALVLRNAGTVDANDSFIDVSASQGAITAGNIAIDSSGPLTLRFANGGGLRTSGDADLASNRAIALTHGDRTAASDSLAAGDRLLIVAQGNVTGGLNSQIRAGGSAVVESQAGSIRLARLAAGGDINLRALSGEISVNEDLAAGGLVDASAPLGVALRALGNLRAATTAGANGAITVLADGALTLDRAEGSALAAEAGGDLIVRNATVGTEDIRATSRSGSVSLTDATAAKDIVVRAGADTAIGGSVRAPALVDIAATGTARVDGQLTGGRVIIGSGDIILSSGGGVLAAVDAPGTTGVLTLNATGAGTTFIGGPDRAGSYSLSGTEMAALRGERITINAPGNTEVGSFTMAGGANGNFADGGVLSIITPDTIRINGAVRLNAMQRETKFVLEANERITMDPATGSIDLRLDDTGALGGHLSMRSNGIYVATDAAIAAIAGQTDTRAIDARLARNDGIVRPDNIVRAIDITLDVNEGAYVQNVGAGLAHVDRRGFLSTGSTLEINTASAATRIVINGQLEGDGTPAPILSGLDVTPIIMVNGVRGPVDGLFDQRSTVNGCLLVNPGSCRASFRDDRGGGQLVRDTFDLVLDTDPFTRFAPPFAIAEIELRDVEPRGYPPLIDEPVTGAGNDDLWQCDRDEPACPAPKP
ncbi:hypothetical protein WG908_10305 [Sphingobium sp. AN641]|uniref:hypothetical protein n=1 Tax=Sphingobium sp. AN641 TaxID=3133443 RepID=UPI0030BE44FC